LEMLKEELTTSQIAAKYSIHQAMLNKWRNVFFEEMPRFFADPRKKSPDERHKNATIEDRIRSSPVCLVLPWQPFSATPRVSGASGLRPPESERLRRK
jgi:transposase-like protein